MKKILLLILSLIFSAPSWPNKNIDLAIKQYNPQTTLVASAARGKEKWFETRNVEGKERNCTKCHGEDLTKSGKHVKTGKTIDPLAASVNAERFTDLKKIEKWFKRNCKWTFERECTAQEKIDFLEYLRQF
ncbi:MAG: DUF1924 domain-containing protein [Gammaproteobacteria bacterium]|nr:DUF1924 domain-containing protein [Gammaproteobacteria bacterium]